MVMASPSGFHYGPYVRGLVISVQQSNSVPDAAIRGMSDRQPWSYWIMTSEWEGVAPHIVGPLSSDNVKPLDAHLPKHRPAQ